MSTAAESDDIAAFGKLFLTGYDPNYPDTDDMPMGESTDQYEWIVMIVEGLKLIFRDDPNVFVAGDLFWYPVLGEPETRTAPDAMVVFGRPKGSRASYMQWREQGIPPQVVFEVISKHNRPYIMAKKFELYERFGVEEYYLYDFTKKTFSGFLRDGDRLEPILVLDHWTSPRLGVRFHLRDDGYLEMFGPDGGPFQSFDQLHQEVEAERERAQDFAQQAQAERRRAEAERQKAEAERQKAQAENQRAERLAARLRELGVDPEE
ncbi:MAG: hypothetical protein JWN86_3882 [Planctomycetota bacterium]|nr:hypothetical protein [Planctomycetota bacterium]